MQTFNLNEAANYLKIHPHTLQSHAKRGLIPVCRIGRRWVFLEADLAEYIRKAYSAPEERLQGFHNKEAMQVGLSLNALVAQKLAAAVQGVHAI